MYFLIKLLITNMNDYHTKTNNKAIFMSNYVLFSSHELIYWHP